MQILPVPLGGSWRHVVMFKLPVDWPLVVNMSVTLQVAQKAELKLVTDVVTFRGTLR